MCRPVSKRGAAEQMDTLAHAVIGGLFFSRSGVCAVRHPVEKPFWKDWTLWTAAGFGAMPDLASFGAHFVSMLVTGELWEMLRRFLAGDVMAAAPAVETLPAYVILNYRLTHSLVIALAVGIVIFLFWRRGFLPYLAWPVHILCDIPVHGKSYFSTPVLWPFSDWSFDGWSFGKNLWIVAGYWGVILAVLAWRIAAGRRRDHLPTSTSR